MNIALWIAQILLALVFAGAGLMKATQPLPTLEAKVGGWAHDVPLALIRVIGLAEILGAAGLIAPRAFDVATWLTPAAAAGLAVTMAGAAVVHGRRGETKEVVVNLALLAMAVFVVVGRW